MTRRVEALKGTVQQVHAFLQSRESNLSWKGSEKIEALVQTLRNCREDLEELECLLRSHRNIDSRTRTRLNFARQNIPSIQERLAQRNREIALVLGIMNTKTLARIEDSLHRIFPDDQEGAPQAGAESLANRSSTSSVPAWDSGRTPGPSDLYEAQLASAGGDAILLNTRTGSHTGRPPSPMPSTMPPSQSNDIANVHLCTFVGCAQSYPGKGFRHPFDLEEHFRVVHHNTASVDTYQIGQASQRPVYVGGNTPRSYANTFAVEGSSGRPSQSRPQRAGSLRSTRPPSVSTSPWAQPSPISSASGSLGSTQACHMSSFSSTRRSAHNRDSLDLSSGSPVLSAGQQAPSAYASIADSTSSSAATAEAQGEFPLRRQSSAPNLRQRQVETVSRGNRERLPARNVSTSRNQARHQRQQARRAEQRREIDRLADQVELARQQRDERRMERDHYRILAAPYMSSLASSSAPSADGEVRSV